MEDHKGRTPSSPLSGRVQPFYILCYLYHNRPAFVQYQHHHSQVHKSICYSDPEVSKHSTGHLAPLPQRIEPLGHLLHMVDPQQGETLLPLNLLPPRPHELRPSHQWGPNNLPSLTLLLLLIWPLTQK